MGSLKRANVRETKEDACNARSETVTITRALIKEKKVCKRIKSLTREDAEKSTKQTTGDGPRVKKHRNKTLSDGKEKFATIGKREKPRGY